MFICSVLQLMHATVPYAAEVATDRGSGDRLDPLFPAIGPTCCKPIQFGHERNGQLI